MDLRGCDAMDPRHSADLRGSAHRPGSSGSVARLQGTSRIPWRGVRDRGAPGRARQLGFAGRRRDGSSGRRGASTAPRDGERTSGRRPPVSAIGADTLPGADGGLPGVIGDYHGRVTRRLEGAGCWVEVLAAGGPRVVGFGLRGGHNVLTETPDTAWDSGFGRYELLGGHRLWFAPETPECSVPDQHGLTISAEAGGLRLVGAVEPPTGIRKAFEIRLDPEAAALSIRHELLNEGSRILELSPWPITQLRPGGVAVVKLPLPVAEHILQPNQVLVLWPYSSWADDRMSIGERAITVTARPGKPFKMGFLSHSGSVGFLRDGLLFLD